MEKISKGLGLVERALEILEKYKIRTVFKGCFIILIIAAVIGFINNPTWIFDKYQEWEEKQHTEKMELTYKNNEKLHIITEKLLYKTDAKRVMVLSLHNGNESNGGLPFAKCSAVYEALNDNVPPIAGQYQETQLSLIPFATELFKNGYWCGDVEELKKYDKGLYYKMKSNETEHFAAYVVRGIDGPLAFIFVSFDPVDTTHKCTDVKESIIQTGLEMAVLMELNKR